MTSSIGNINIFSYGNSFATSGAAGKLYVPVSRSALLYSHFDHVSGVAAKSGQSGVSISKIQILNSLIESLTALKGQPRISVTDISDEQADALIKNYQQQIQMAVQNPYTAGAKPQSGEIFTLLA
jgi:hypothetical protein